MKLRVSPPIFEKFPGLNLGMVVAKNLDNTGSSEEIRTLLKDAEKQIRESLQPEILPRHPKIEAWRNAYISFGAKPKEHRSSIENLCRLVLGGIDLKHVNKLVDIYNYISLKHMLPVGGEDLDKIQGDVLLTFARENEPGVTLLGDKDPRPPHEGEVIYKDNISAICRRWNWREAERTKLTEETRSSLLAIEGLPPVSKEEVQAATTELKGLIEKYCGGEVNYEILDPKNTSASLK